MASESPHGAPRAVSVPLLCGWEIPGGRSHPGERPRRPPTRRAKHPALPEALGTCGRRGGCSSVSPGRARASQGLVPLGASSGSPGCRLLLTNVSPLLVSRYNSAKKDNDFIYHEAVPALDTLQSVKGEAGQCPLPPTPDGTGTRSVPRCPALRGSARSDGAERQDVFRERSVPRGGFRHVLCLHPSQVLRW